MKDVVLPPSSLFICALAAALRVRRRCDPWWWLLLVVLALLYLLSAPFFADRLLASLEKYPPLNEQGIAASHAQAIVVLSAESRMGPEFGGATVGPLTLARLRYGAYLQSLTHLPILVSGGRPPDASISMAGVMKVTLQREYGLSRILTEDCSMTTHENAAMSALILKKNMINRIYLVTNAWHMPRAYKEFTKAGLQVVAAPTGFTDTGGLQVMDLLPSVKALSNSYYAIYELAGGLYYDLKGAYN